MLILYSDNILSNWEIHISNDNGQSDDDVNKNLQVGQNSEENAGLGAVDDQFDQLIDQLKSIDRLDDGAAIDQGTLDVQNQQDRANSMDKYHHKKFAAKYFEHRTTEKPFELSDEFWSL